MRKEEQILLLEDFLETRNLADSKISNHLEIAWECIMDEEPEECILSHLDALLYEGFKRLPKDIKEEKHLFRFVRFPSKKEDEEKLIKGIEDNSISLSSTENYNDPMDPIVDAWIERRCIHSTDKRIEKSLYKLMTKSLYKTRICSLVDPLQNKMRKKWISPKIEDCNPLMWAHYADMHKGICIQYKIKPSNIYDTEDTVVRLLEVNYDKPLPLESNISFVDSLIVKGKCWKYENETRLIMYSPNNKKKYCKLQNFEIEAVYMGWRIDSVKRDYLKEMLKGTDIKLYQMVFSPKDITKLVAKEI